MNLDTLTSLAARGRDLWERNLPRALRASLPVNGGTSPWFRVRNVDATTAEILLYGAIDPWEINALDFVTTLNDITVSTINLRVNSPGGFVFDAVAIYSALKNHPSTVNVTVDALAASAASFIAMAGDSIAIEKPAKMMIHDAQGLAYGSPAEVLDLYNLLEDLSNTIAQIYTDRAGGTQANWRAAMTDTTWYGAQQAVDAGLADRVAGSASAPAKTEPPASNVDARTIGIRARAAATLGGVK